MDLYLHFILQMNLILVPDDSINSQRSPVYTAYNSFQMVFQDISSLGLFEDIVRFAEARKRSYPIKQPETVTGSTVYRGTNELPQKTF